LTSALVWPADPRDQGEQEAEHCGQQRPHGLEHEQPGEDSAHHQAREPERGQNGEPYGGCAGRCVEGLDAGGPSSSDLPQRSAKSAKGQRMRTQSALVMTAVMVAAAVSACVPCGGSCYR
jgi:hypothetical protein